MNRRRFLITTASIGGLALGGLALGYRELSAAVPGGADPAEAGAGESVLAGWLKIGTDDTVTIFVPHVDFGQGVHTALAMMAAEELDADWARVRAEQAPGDKAFANRFLARGWIMQDRGVPEAFDGVVDTVFATAARATDLQITGGSTAVRLTGQTGMRMTGAAARDMLIAAAAERWQLPATELATSAGLVLHEASGRSLRYGELAASAARLAVPSHPALKSRSQFRLVGTSPPRPDIPAKTTGAMQFGIDVQLPQMRYAALAAAPAHGGSLGAVDPAPALAIAGVERVVELRDAVAVVATKYWTARKALADLRPTFEAAPGEADLSSEVLFARQSRALESPDAKVRHRQGDIALRDGTGRIVEAHYRVPFLHHAQLEPINATAQWSDAKLRFWGGAQNPLWTRQELARLAGIRPENVVLQTMPMGGSFGRRSLPAMTNYLPQIVEIAKAASPHPVKMLWSREEDFAQGAFRPALCSRIRAALDAGGLPLTWDQVFIDAPGRNEAFMLPYRIPNQSIRSVPVPHSIRIGAWRSVAHTQHGYYTECFIDELAHAAGRDPFEYRCDLLPAGSRHRRVLETAARQAGWGTPVPAGSGRGIALVESFGSIVAEVVEASIDADGLPRVHRVVAAVDCGALVHPDTAAQQIEGGIVMGLSAALAERITIASGAVEQKNFHDYPLLTMARTPAVEVSFLQSDGVVGGLGEPGVPPAAPALANALFAATGTRSRELPVTMT